MKRCRSYEQSECEMRLHGVSRVISCLFIAAVVTVAHADESKTISAVYTFDTPQIESSGQYTRLIVPGCGQLNRAGDPAMPFRTARLSRWRGSFRSSTSQPAVNYCFPEK